ncbi:MAG: hypothetical protein EBY24_17280 [Betaproteobacteria bacterium]|nr:hypothetical protein [Betaproteobacteria bacterium]
MIIHDDGRAWNTISQATYSGSATRNSITRPIAEACNAIRAHAQCGGVRKVNVSEEKTTKKICATLHLFVKGCAYHITA